ncbi:hypothetical protein [Vibrio sp. SCSIO 43155]|uniref:hypothetical protein n=1 Tax=Vibrio TaxID=662 RepID=UPI002074ECB8|nr:hypothetical protein [Vibrio sp. SCSIO 43155]USD58580.1 hypothetical protein J4N44_26880 [Vibrio sp. SCSIO 43155]
MTVDKVSESKPMKIVLIKDDGSEMIANSAAEVAKRLQSKEASVNALMNGRFYSLKGWRPKHSKSEALKERRKTHFQHIGVQKSGYQVRVKSEGISVYCSNLNEALCTRLSFFLEGTLKPLGLLLDFKDTIHSGAISQTNDVNPVDAIQVNYMELDTCKWRNKVFRISEACYRDEAACRRAIKAFYAPWVENYNRIAELYNQKRTNIYVELSHQEIKTGKPVMPSWKFDPELWKKCFEELEK